jgi:hypothetical protein
MSKLVLFYSLSGNTEKKARSFAETNGAAVVKVEPAAGLGKVKAYSAGLAKSILGKSIAVKPLTIPKADEIHVFAPVWAGTFAAPIGAALAYLPKGAKVSLHMVSMSGTSNTKVNTDRAKALGLDVISYEDIR